MNKIETFESGQHTLCTARHNHDEFENNPDICETRMFVARRGIYVRKLVDFSCPPLRKVATVAVAEIVVDVVCLGVVGGR